MAVRRGEGEREREHDCVNVCGGGERMRGRERESERVEFLRPPLLG